MDKEKNKYFPLFWKEMLFVFVCLVLGTAAAERGLTGTSYLLFVAAGIVFIVAFFTLIIYCGDNNNGK